MRCIEFKIDPPSQRSELASPGVAALMEVDYIRRLVIPMYCEAPGDADIPPQAHECPAGHTHVFLMIEDWQSDEWNVTIDALRAGGASPGGLLSMALKDVVGG